MCQVFPIVPLLVIALSAIPLSVAAQTSDHYALGPIKVEIVENDDAMQELRYQGKVLLTDDRVALDAPLQMGDVTLRVGAARQGGNSCGGARFILWQRAGQVAVSDLTDSCSPAQPVLDQGRLFLKAPPRPGTPGEVWEWTPSGGLVALEPEAFAPDPRLGWEDLARLEVAHPIEALKIAPVYLQLQNEMKPAQFATLTQTLSELGSGEVLPQGYAGQSCLKLECDQVFAHLWVDRKSQRSYALWADGETTYLHPEPIEDWPQWVALRASQIFTRAD